MANYKISPYNNTRPEERSTFDLIVEKALYSFLVLAFILFVSLFLVYTVPS